jgi:hypothetical protein
LGFRNLPKTTAMRIEQVVVQILLNSKKAKDENSAVQLIKAAFYESVPHGNYDSWNREISDAVARRLIENAKVREKIILSILIKDLDTIAKGLLSLTSLYFMS